MVPFEAGRQGAAAIPNGPFVPRESQNYTLPAQEKAWAMFQKEVDDFLDADEHVGPVADGGAGLTERERELLDSSLFHEAARQKALVTSPEQPGGAPASLPVSIDTDRPRTFATSSKFLGKCRLTLLARHHHGDAVCE